MSVFSVAVIVLWVFLSSCVLLERSKSILFSSQERRLSIALAPLWLPQESPLASDWLFRRKRMAYIDALLSRHPSDFWLLTHLVSELPPGEESEVSLFSAGSWGGQRILWIPHPAPPLSGGAFQTLSSAFVWQNTIPSFAEGTLKTQLLSSSSRDGTVLSPYLASWRIPWKGQALLVVLVHLPPSSYGFPTLLEALKKLISEHEGLGGCVQRVLVMGLWGEPQQDLSTLGLKDGAGEACLEREKQSLQHVEEALCVSEDPRNPLAQAFIPTRYQRIWVPEGTEMISATGVMNEFFDFSSLNPSRPSTWLSALPLGASYGLRLEMNLPHCGGA